jgi:hypothetical protein
MIITIKSQVIIVSIIYALLVLFGAYGFGTDYYAAYRFESHINLGWSIATIHIGDLALGMAFISFLVSYSFGNILILDSRIHGYAFPKFSYLLLLHSWPLIMFSLNVARQGLLTALFYFSIYLYMLNYRKLSLLIMFLLFQIHKVVVVLLPVFLLSIISIRFKSVALNSMRYIYVLLLLLLFIFSIIGYQNIAYLPSHSENSRVINGDFSSLFFILNVSYILLYIKNIKALSKNMIESIIFYGSITCVSMYMLGYNWEHERVNMTFILLYVVFFRQLIFERLKKIYYITISAALFSITIYQGILLSLR